MQKGKLFLKNTMHIISKRIVEYTKSKGIVIGRGWKQSIGMRSKNNQNFVQIPFNTLRQKKMALMFSS
ncbi:MAG: hypothetical protein QXG99_02275 [Conexivisphaerales archaeon]